MPEFFSFSFFFFFFGSLRMSKLLNCCQGEEENQKERGSYRNKKPNHQTGKETIPSLFAHIPSFPSLLKFHISYGH